MSKIEQFVELFSEFDLEVVLTREIRQTANISTSDKTVSDLNKSLKRLEKEYKQAVKSFKANKITKHELYEFE